MPQMCRERKRTHVSYFEHSRAVRSLTCTFPASLSPFNGGMRDSFESDK